MKATEQYLPVVLFPNKICCTRCFYHILSLWIKAAERYFSLVLFIGHQEVLLAT